MTHAIDKVITSNSDRLGSDEGLLSSARFSLLVHKERLRSDRHRLVFSIAVFRLILHSEQERPARTSLLSKILFDRLRLTDERGLDDNGDIVVLLPHTRRDGALFVSNSVVKSARDVGLVVGAKVYTYPEPEIDEDSDDPNDSYNGEMISAAMKSGYSDPESVDIDTKKTTAVVVDRKRVEIGRSLDFIAPKYPAWKRLSDLLLSTLGLIIVSPILLAAAVAIKATSTGPVLFMQWRTGQNGKPFRICKLRTMVVDAEELKAKLRESNERDGPAFKMKFDPRVTRVGRFLRATGLDELPQLWNVVKGDMAIVGPRPLPCDEDASCEQWQRRRLDTKPGITCFWQIMKSRVEAFDDWMRLDLRYLAKRSFLQDIRLMMKTVVAVVLGRVGH